MSNLINRQAAIEVASKECYELRGVFGQIEEGLNELPTVEAIPIEWIKKYASMKRTNDEMDCYWHFWEEDVLKMVDEWEKENESDCGN